MNRILLSAGLALACAVPAQAQDQEAAWFADFDQAVAAAKDQGKDLFVDFTGSDWCGWCMKLHEEVFSHEEFLKPVQEKYVLVALDFPRGEEAKAAVPNPERNDELLEKYGIEGFPTCLLMTPAGVVYGRTGYREGGPEAYVEHLRELAASGKKILAQLKELKQEFQAAEDKAPVIDKAITLLADMNPDSPGVTVVAEMVGKALKLDPENKKGMKLRAVKALLDSGQAKDEILAAARNMDPKNENGLLEKVVGFQFGKVRDEQSALAAISSIEKLLELGNFQDKAQVKQMAAMAALWCDGPLQDHERALALAEKAKAIDAELDPRLQEAFDKIGQPDA
ncbi:MAG: thioredoxin family protein [Planctomycetota bacterium]|nr:MAG: thioredoxin family protein [Planctomycetota bacterium]